MSSTIFPSEFGLGMKPAYQSTSVPSCGNGQRAEPMEVWKARNYIRENLTDKISLREVANAARICPTYLSEKFREVTGENFVAYVARSRVEMACELLRDPTRRISDIAFTSGFQSLSQFNRAFRKLRGESPRTYRLRHLARPQATSVVNQS